MIPGANFSLNLGANSATNFSVNLGRNLALSPAPAQLPNVPAAVTPPIPAVVPVQTNGLTGDTLRALLVLQSDMERMLPILSALSGATNATQVVDEAAAAGAANESEAE